jgi:UMP-CMP kinase
VGDLLREERDRPASNFADFIDESMRSAVTIPAQLTVSLLHTKMSGAIREGTTRFLVDGFPRSMDQAIEFEQKVSLDYD